MGVSMAAAIALLLGNGTISTWVISENKEDQFFFHVADHGAGCFVRRNWIRLFFR
jgi:hypothetical protein